MCGKSISAARRRLETAAIGFIARCKSCKNELLHNVIGVLLVIACSEQYFEMKLCKHCHQHTNASALNIMRLRVQASGRCASAPVAAADVTSAV
jgi:hypothetical protein